MNPHLISLLFTILSISSIAQQKRLYIANDDHTDYMWTADESRYDSAFLHMLDYYLDEIDRTQTDEPDFQTRFNCDGSFWLRTYEKYRSAVQFDRLIEAIRSGHISSPLTALANTYGAQPTEAVIRGMYYPGHLERRYDLRFPLAVAMENQTLPLGLSALWAGAGAKYSWRGICACASRLPDEHWMDRKYPLYRFTGLDGSSVLMKWYELTYNNASLGGYGETRMEYKPISPDQSLAQTIETLDALCNNVHPSHGYPYHIAAAFGYGWDDLETYVSPAFIKAARNSANEQRRVRVSNEIDFFEDIERNYPSLPSETVTYGNEWDLYCASMNETTARIRRSTEKLRSAEALSAIASVKDKDLLKSVEEARAKAHDAYGLYWEHDWTADGPVSKSDRAAWQVRMQQQISGYVDTLYHRSMTSLARQLSQGEHPRYVVFNPLSWKRNDIVDLPFQGKDGHQVFDLTTGERVPCQRMKIDGKSSLRIWARGIPSVGYKIYEVRPGEETQDGLAATYIDGHFENAWYKVRFHRSGTISQMYDKKAGGRPMVKETDGKYLNDLGTADLEDGEPVVIENAGPVSVTIKAVSDNPILHTVRLTLYRDSPRIDIMDSIQSNFSDIQEWSFSFDLDTPTTHHEELGAILTVKKLAQGGHYADRNARYDYQTFNHFADISTRDYGITLSNLDCSFFRLGQSTPDSLWDHSSQLHALAGGQVDGETLGIQDQFGETAFAYHFALRSHPVAFDPAAAMKFSLEHQNPLSVALVTGQHDVDQTHFSLLSLNDPDILLWSVKPAEEGIDQGLITRLWNTHAEPTEVQLTFSKPIQEAWRTSHIETNLQQLKHHVHGLPIHLSGNQIGTFRCMLRNKL